MKTPIDPLDPATSGSAEQVASLLKTARGVERAAISRFASSLSHALGTPLNVIAGRAAMIAMAREGDAQIADNARIIEERVRAITQTIQQVLAYVRSGRPPPERQDMQKLMRHAAELLRPLAQQRGIFLSEAAGAPLEANVVGDAVLEVLVLLVASGFDWVERGASIELDVTRCRLEPPASERGRAASGDYARFVVNWPKTEVPAECLRGMHEPWFEPVSPCPELSLDLATCYGIAREHHGWIEASVEPGRGTTLAVNWPLNG